jgi:glycogen debranching enzyme
LSEIIRVKNQYYILATSSFALERVRVLKHGDMFAVFDAYGDIQPVGLGEQGIFHEGTRFLSRMAFHVGNERPLLLSSNVEENNLLLTIDVTNPDVHERDELVIPRGTLHILRSKFLWNGVCYERVQVTNYGEAAIPLDLGFDLDSDFADIFQVRGTKRARVGRKLRTLVKENTIVISYEGLDGVTRSSRILCSPTPDAISASGLRFKTRIEPKAALLFFLTVVCERNGARTESLSYPTALQQASSTVEGAKRDECSIYTSNEQFNEWVKRSMADLRMMVTDTPEGPYPYAGVPWFSTVFGRDGIITALETLWIAPHIARGVLSFLASTQAIEVDPASDAEPGKILHEMRKGEMAALGEIAFGQYYGSVDATPLFVMLAQEYYERSGDRTFLEGIWPNVERALEWIDRFGDVDGDGFVEYERRSPRGLANQGWKDSHDAIFHADGKAAHGSIALCEVQGYVYAAKRSAAKLARLLGKRERGEELARQATQLRGRFEQAFWCDEIASYALALDGDKRPCRVRTSNAGHCLFTGVAEPKHALRTAGTLLSGDSFSGWGIRTVAASEPRYNPMSYHNGAVWPHDNALVAQGLARYGRKDLAVRLLGGMFDASLFVELGRLPELLCGFPRRAGEGPTLYPVACSPQSWSAAAVFLLLRACLGLSIDAARSQLKFSFPVLPRFLSNVEIRNLRVGDASVDLALHRYPDSVGINVLRRDGDVEVVALA